MRKVCTSLSAVAVPSSPSLGEENKVELLVDAKMVFDIIFGFGRDGVLAGNKRKGRRMCRK